VSVCLSVRLPETRWHSVEATNQSQAAYGLQFLVTVILVKFQYRNLNCGVKYRVELKKNKLPPKWVVFRVTRSL